MNDKKLKIAQVAPTWVKVPPEQYGGAELIISHLANGLSDLGHDVTLFASGDSETKAKLVSRIETAGGIGNEPLADFSKRMRYYLTTIDPLLKSEFDIIHWHVSYDLLPYFIAQIPSRIPSVVTFHNYYEGIAGHVNDLFDVDSRSFNVAISNNLIKQIPIKFAKVIYNGIDLEDFNYSEETDDYMVWVGRFKEIKGPDIAIEVADKLKKELRLAAEPRENEFYNNKIVPMLEQSKYSKYVGAVSKGERDQLVGKAKLFINPIKWEEPFGLVVPEANACGTPVIAYDRGAMSELIKDGFNGYLVKPDDIKALEETIEKLYAMRPEEYLQMRKNARKHVEENFTVEKMVSDYEDIYKEIVTTN